MRRVAAALAVTAGLLVGTGPGGLAQSEPAAPRPGITVRLLDAPRETPDPRARVAIVDTVTPASTWTWRVEFSNGDPEPLPLSVYAADASATSEWLVQPGRGTSELASWISTSPQEVVVAPGGREVIDVTIAIPANATGGERYAAVMAEPPARGEGSVGVVARVGVRVYLTVDAPGGPGGQSLLTDFRIDTLQAVRSDAGVPGVLIGVTNTGDLAIDVAGSLRLTDGPGGVSTTPYPVVVPATLGPGFSGEVVVKLDPEIPSGPWLAIADLRSGLVQRSASATIVFPNADGGSAPPVPAKPYETQRRILIPVASLLLGLAIALWWLLLLYKRREDDEDDEDDEGGQDQADQLGPGSGAADHRGDAARDVQSSA